MRRRTRTRPRAEATSTVGVGFLGPVAFPSATAGQVPVPHPVPVPAPHVAKLIGWETVPCVIAHNLDDALLALKAELHENAYRENMTATDMLELGRRIEELEKPEAKRRQTATLKQNAKDDRSGKLPQRQESGRANDKVAEAVGVSRRTYEKIKQVASAAEKEPDKFGDLLAMMDEQSVDAALPPTRGHNLNCELLGALRGR